MRTRLCWTIPLMFVTGCSARAPVATTPTRISSRSTSSHPLSSLSTQDRNKYAAATRAFKAKDYPLALSMVIELERAYPDEAARGFLSKQHEIILAAESGKAPTPATVATAVSKIHPTRRKADSNCGPRALAIVCQLLGKPLVMEKLAEWAGTNERGTTLEGLKRAAEKAGFAADGVQLNRTALDGLKQPAVAWVDGDHFIAVLEVGDGTARVRDPNRVEEEYVPVDTLLRRSGGVLLKLKTEN